MTKVFQAKNEQDILDYLYSRNYIDFLYNLAQRWIDERGMDNLKDYELEIKKQIPELTINQCLRRPFRIVFPGRTIWNAQF